MEAKGDEPESLEEGMAVAQQSHDETSLFVAIPESMNNQIFRYGIMPKKSIDGSGMTRARGSRDVWRDSRTNTPDGALIIHPNDLDPHPNNCDAFIHPPYGSNQQYRGPKDQDYTVFVTLAELARGAQKCGFCSVLYQGIHLMRYVWISGWARYQWISSHPDCNIAETQNETPWLDEFRDEIELDKAIDEDELGLNITLPKGQEPLFVQMRLVNRRQAPSEDRPNWPETEAQLREALNNPTPLQRITELEFYTALESPSPWAAFGPAPHIHPEILSDACLNKISRWLRECVFHHPACVERPWTSKLQSTSKPSHEPIHRGKRNSSQFLGRTSSSLLNRDSKQETLLEDGFPLRLLRLEWGNTDEDKPPHVRLEDTIDAQAIYTYVALSHVWAFTEPYKTTRENYSDHKTRVPWEHLSIPLREAIVLAISLRLEYIWVDSLCIIQDDLADRENELPRMSLIYGRAEVVFAAHGTDLGFRKVPLQSVPDPTHENDAAVYCRQKMNHKNLFSAPGDSSSWFGRAWCLQERMFAPRILHFGGSWEELFFECNTLITCECGGLDKDGGQRQITLKEEITNALASIAENTESMESCNELWKVYITACENYTPRGVSFSTDTLPAISSLMCSFMPHLGRYYAGLWEHNLLVGLQWEAQYTKYSARHESYVAPSFSWASRSGGVIWYLELDELPTSDTHEFASIIDISCELAGNNPCGNVSSGYITLRGYTTEMKIESKLMWPPDGRLEMTKDGAECCFVTLDSKQDLERVQTGTTVKCLDLMRDQNGFHGNYSSGLVLLPVDGDNNRYCRIGISTMLEDHFKDSVLEDITIV